MFLGHALQYERIFIWDPDGKHVGQEYVDPGCGRGELYSNWDCLFEPLSICAASNATRSEVLLDTQCVASHRLLPAQP